MTGKNDHLENTDTSKAYTLGQKLYMLGIGLLVFVVVIGLIIYFVRRYVRAQFPAISAAIDGLIKAGDQVIAKRIAELRIKQAAATDPTVKTAIADTISDLESARGQVVAERAKMDV
jgi:cytochrome b subunit of formate dehydrogenase